MTEYTIDGVSYTQWYVQASYNYLQNILVIEHYYLLFFYFL